VQLAAVCEALDAVKSRGQAEEAAAKQMALLQSSSREDELLQQLSQASSDIESLQGQLRGALLAASGAREQVQALAACIRQLEAGKGELLSCLSALKATAQEQINQIGFLQNCATSQEAQNRDLSDTVKKLQTEASGLQSCIAAATAELQAQAEQYDVKIEALELQLQDEARQREQLELQNGILQHELEDLEAQLAQKEAEKDDLKLRQQDLMALHSSEVDKLRQTMTQWRTQAAQSKQHMDEAAEQAQQSSKNAEVARAETAAVRQDLAQAEARTSGMQKLLDAAHAAAIEGAGLAELEGLSRGAPSKPQAWDADHQAALLAAAQRDCAAQKLAATEREEAVLDLKHRLKEAQDARNALASEASQMRASIGELERSKSDLAAHCTGLQANVDKLAGTLAATHQEMAAQTTRIQELEAERSTLLAQADELESRLSHEENRARILASENAAAGVQLSSSALADAEERNQLLQLVVDCRAAQDEAQRRAQQVQELSRQLDKMQAQLSSAHAARDDEERKASQLQRALEELQRELRQVQTSVRAASTDMQDRHSALKEEAENLRCTADKRAAAVAELERLLASQRAVHATEAREQKAATEQLQAELAAAVASREGMQKLFDYAQSQLAAVSASATSAEQVCTFMLVFLFLVAAALWCFVHDDKCSA
jgi:chromosome segregation ATPase